MADTNATLNPGQGQDGGAPSAPAGEATFKAFGDGLVSTVERATPPPPAADAGGQKSGEKGEAGGGEQPPFHDHPRWKEVLGERDAARSEAQELKDRISRLETERTRPAATPPAEKEEDLPFKDVTKLTPEEVAEWKAEDPVGYEANLARQVAYETERRILGNLEQKGRMQKVAETFQQYEKDNPEFRKMWDSGEIPKYMEDHPGHNAISAYIMLTGPKANEKTIKDAEGRGYQRALDDIKARGGAKVMGAGPASSGRVATDEDPRLKDPAKFGGEDSVLLARLRERRAASG